MPRTIEDRLRFMKLDGAASTHVRNLKPVVMKALPAAESAPGLLPGLAMAPVAQLPAA